MKIIYNIYIYNTAHCKYRLVFYILFFVSFLYSPVTSQSVNIKIFLQLNSAVYMSVIYSDERNAKNSELNINTAEQNKNLSFV